MMQPHDYINRKGKLPTIYRRHHQHYEQSRRICSTTTSTSFFPPHFSYSRSRCSKEYWDCRKHRQWYCHDDSNRNSSPEWQQWSLGAHAATKSWCIMERKCHRQWRNGKEVIQALLYLAQATVSYLFHTVVSSSFALYSQPFDPNVSIMMQGVWRIIHWIRWKLELRRTQERTEENCTKEKGWQEEASRLSTVPCLI